MAGTRWVQKEILEKYPDADVKVYAVWFNVMRSDSREAWRDDLIRDPRATLYWNENQSVGQWYSNNVTRPGEMYIEWDAWFLYEPGVEWGGEPPKHTAWGRTIIDTAEKLEEKFLALTKVGAGSDS